MKSLPSKSLSLTKLLICLGLLLLATYAYWGLTRAGFIGFDDPVYVVKNFPVQQGLTTQGTAWAFTTGHGGNWHPLTWLSHMLDVQLFGLNPVAHHLVNLFFHLANTVLLFLLLSQLTATVWRSAFVALLFSLHPLHVESVAWIAERKDVLSTFFGLWTIWFYADYVRAIEKSHGTRSFLVAHIFFALALLCKPMLVTLPCLLVLLDFWPLRRFGLPGEAASQGGFFTPAVLWKFAREKLFLFEMAAISSVVTFFVQDSAGAMASLERLSLGHRIGNAFVAYIAYLGKMIWPRDLAVLYPIQTWPLWQTLAAALLLAVVTFLVVRGAQKRPYLFTGWFWYLGMLVPVIGVVHVGSQWMADRYTYLPMVGVLIIIAWGAADLLRGRALRWLAAAAAVGIAGVSLLLTRQQVALWRDSETLFTHSLRVTKRNVLLLSNLAAEYLDKGNLDRAIELLTEAISIRGDHAGSWSNLGAAYERRGDLDRAIDCYSKALDLDPKNAEAQNNFGYVLLTHGRADLAIPHFQSALQRSPQFAEANYNFGNALFLQGKPADALPYYEKAVLYRTNYAEAHNNLARIALTLGQLDKALEHSQIALKLKPDMNQARETTGNVLWQRGRVGEAENCFRELTKADPANANYADSLGLVLMSQKKFAEAAGMFSNAVSLESRRPAFHFHYGNALMSLQQQVQARQEYRLATTLDPDFAEAHYQLAMILLAEKRTEEAADELAVAVKVKPRWQEALNNLAWIRATDKEPHVRDGVEAVHLAEQALKLGGESAATLDTLAAAYAEQGKFADAITTAKKAIALANTALQGNMAQDISNRLKAYEQNTPWREP